MGHFSRAVDRIGSGHMAMHNRSGPLPIGSSVRYPRFVLRCTKSVARGLRGRVQGPCFSRIFVKNFISCFTCKKIYKFYNLAHIFPYQLIEKRMPTTSDLKAALAAYNKEHKKLESKKISRIKEKTIRNLPKRNKALKEQPLTRKQELFVKELVTKDGQITLRQAAINAGYSAGSAHQRAYELTNPQICPHVVRHIKAYRDELDHKYGIDYKRHIRDLQIIRDRALDNGAYSAAVQAEYRRGQAHGDIYINKSEIRHGSIDSMSKEDVLKALEEIKEGYAPITIDVTPEREADSEDSPEEGERSVENDEDSLGEEREEDRTHTP
jgi:hypothetical protein